MNISECKDKIIKLEQSLNKQNVNVEYNDVIANLLGGTYKEMHITKLDIAKEEIKIIDEDGKFSAKINEVEDKLHLSVLPLEVCGIPQAIKSLKNHELLNICGKRCVSSTNRIIQKELVDSTLLTMSRTLSKGDTYMEEITQDVHIKDSNYKVLKFNMYELTHLSSYYKNCEVKCVEKEDKTYLIAYLV